MSTPDNRLALAIWSGISCIVSELSKKGLIDVADIVQNMQETAIAKRSAGDKEQNAAMLHTLSEHLLITVRDAERQAD